MKTSHLKNYSSLVYISLGNYLISENFIGIKDILRNHLL